MAKAVKDAKGGKPAAKAPVKTAIAKAVAKASAKPAVAKPAAAPQKTAAAPRAAAKLSAVAAITLPRNAKHAGRSLSRSGVSIATLPPAQRLSLRAPVGSVAAFSKALGIDLPTRPKTSISSDGRHALWLGPDEWLVMDDNGADLMAAAASVKELGSAVDVSHRNVGIDVRGAQAEAVLSAGCPQDLSLAVFPVGAASRTILGKVEVVLLRTAPDEFRVECWRSFSDYVWDFLAEAAKDTAA